MKNIINLLIIIALAFCVISFLGCNGGDSGSSSGSTAGSNMSGDDEDDGGSPAGGSAPSGPGMTPSGPGMTPSGPGMTPSTPGMTPSGPGMTPGMTGAPMGGPGMMGADTGASAGAARPTEAKITFAQAPKASKVQTFIKKDGITFLVFKFVDEKGTLYKCKLPKAESLGTWTKKEWLSTFKAYRYLTCHEQNEIAAKQTKEKLGSYDWAIKMGASQSRVLGYPKLDTETVSNPLLTNNAINNMLRPGAGLNMNGMPGNSPMGVGPMGGMTPGMGMNPGIGGTMGSGTIGGMQGGMNPPMGGMIPGTGMY